MRRSKASAGFPPPSSSATLPLQLPPPNPLTLTLRLPKFFTSSPTQPSSSPDLTKAASPSPGLRQAPGGGSSSSKPTFASALRDLAKNAGDGEPQRRPGPPTPTPIASTLQDVRKVGIEKLWKLGENILISDWYLNIDSLKSSKADSSKSHSVKLDIWSE